MGCLRASLFLAKIEVKMSYICQECHETKYGCCNFTGEPNSIEIGISIPEAIIIQKATKLSISDFLERDTINPLLVDSIARSIHPNFKQIFYKNIRYKLKTVDNKCIFLTDQGCQLPRNIRPHYCNLYPFWLMPDEDRLQVLINPDCLAQTRALNIVELLKLFGINRNDIINEFYALQDKLKEHLAFIDSGKDIIQ
jgi:Fe-S-cluster containining protein